VRMPVCRPTPYSHDALHRRALGDFQFELWQDSEPPLEVAEEMVASSTPKRRKSNVDGLYTLVHRPRDPKGMPTVSERDSENESSSDESGFMLVHRPKPPVSPSAATDSSSSYPSSPELVCTTPTEVKAHPQSETTGHAGADDSGTDLEDDWLTI